VTHCRGISVISNSTEYEKAREQLVLLEERLERLEQVQPLGAKGLTKAGIRLRRKRGSAPKAHRSEGQRLVEPVHC
jgi:hypothetical protein